MPHNQSAAQVRLFLTEAGIALTVRFTRDHIRKADLRFSSTETCSQDISNATDRLVISQHAWALMAHPSPMAADAARHFKTYTVT